MKGSTMESISQQAANLRESWETDRRWAGITRDYSAQDVIRLRGSVVEEHTLARRGANRLWELLHTEDAVRALGAITGNQAVQMVKAGLQAIYLSGWQVAADGNLAGQTYPDQSLYPANSVPQMVRRINNAMLRADQIAWSERSIESCAPKQQWLGAIVGGGGGGLRRPAECLRADEGDDRGGRGRRALRGPAVVGEEVRAPRREGPHPDRAAHQDADRRPARRQRARRAH